MSPHERAEAYLDVSTQLLVPRLRWSPTFDALEFPDGRTLALTEEVAQFLEGLLSRPPVPPFPVALLVLAVAKRAMAAFTVELGRLQIAYASRSGPAVGRNTGLLVGEICRSLSPEADPPEWREVVL